MIAPDLLIAGVVGFVLGAGAMALIGAAIIRGERWR